MEIEEKILLSKQIDKLERDLNTKNIEYKMGYQSGLFDVMELINKLPIHTVSQQREQLFCGGCGNKKQLIVETDINSQRVCKNKLCEQNNCA